MGIDASMASPPIPASPTPPADLQAPSTPSRQATPAIFAPSTPTPAAPPTVIDPLVGGEQQPLLRLSRPPSSARILAGGVSARRGSRCPARRGAVRAPPRAVRRGVRHPSRRIHPRLSRPHPRRSASIRARRAPCAYLRPWLPARRPRAPPLVRGRPRVRTRLRPSAVVRPPTASCRRLFIAHRSLLSWLSATSSAHFPTSTVGIGAAEVRRLCRTPRPRLPRPHHARSHLYRQAGPRRRLMRGRHKCHWPPPAPSLSPPTASPTTPAATSVAFECPAPLAMSASTTMDLLGLLDGLLAAGSVVAPPSTFSALAFQLKLGVLTDIIAKNVTVNNFPSTSAAMFTHHSSRTSCLGRVE